MQHQAHFFIVIKCGVCAPGTSCGREQRSRRKKKRNRKKLVSLSFFVFLLANFRTQFIDEFVTTAGCSEIDKTKTKWKRSRAPFRFSQFTVLFFSFLSGNFFGAVIRVLSHSRVKWCRLLVLLFRFFVSLASPDDRSLDSDRKINTRVWGIDIPVHDAHVSPSLQLHRHAWSQSDNLSINVWPECVCVCESMVTEMWMRDTYTSRDEWQSTVNYYNFSFVHFFFRALLQ